VGLDHCPELLCPAFSRGPVDGRALVVLRPNIAAISRACWPPPKLDRFFRCDAADVCSPPRYCVLRVGCGRLAGRATPAASARVSKVSDVGGR